MKSVVIALCTLVAATAAQGSSNLAACGVSLSLFFCSLSLYFVDSR